MMATSHRPPRVLRCHGWVLWCMAWLLAAPACQPSKTSNEKPTSPRSAQTPERARDSSQTDRSVPQHLERQAERRQMVREQMRSRNIEDLKVLAAMERVPRHRFVPEWLLDAAYDDRPLPIGHDQTISQPYIVALMTQLAEVQPNAKVLDIGTGSGYQAAVLAELCQQVYSIEIVERLAHEARARLETLGYRNVEVRQGDGYAGWTEHAPFDAIIVAAAPDHIPPALIEQLAPNGRLVIPVGTTYQELLVVEKTAEGEIRRRTVAPVAFVPMTGAAQKK